MPDENSSADNSVSAAAERRTFTRVFFDAETVVTQGEHIWPVELIDISLRGVLVKNPGDMALDKSQPAEVSIHLTGALVISMKVRVKHVEGDRFGMLCEHIDLDSMIHLRRLVELNTGDTTLLERELSTLG